MTSEVKEKTQWVQEAMAESVQRDLAVHEQPYAEVFLKDYNWGSRTHKSYELTGYRWRHTVRPGPNATGHHPLGHAVLIAPDESQLSAIIELPQEQKEKELMNMTVGRIVEVGPSAWMDEPSPRAFPGEMVTFSKFAGAIVLGKDGKPYRVVNADDVYCRRDEDFPKPKLLEPPRVERREKKEMEND